MPTTKPSDPGKPGNTGRNKASGNGGNAQTGKNFDEQHGARGTQLNPNTTGNPDKSKKGS